MAANKRRLDEKHLKILRELGSQLHNKQCFDCHQRGPTYINMTIGSFVCTSCSGILRGLNPPHRVKSISMTSFTPEEIEFIRSKGNEYCRRVWLGTYDSRSVMEPESKDEQRIKDFMIQKYERKRWYVDPGMIPRSQALPTTPVSTATTSLPEVKPLTALVNNAVKPLIIQNNPVGNSHNRTLATSVSNPGLSSSQQQNSHRPSLDLLSEFAGDPFASASSTTSQTASNANFANFENFNSSVAPPSITSCSMPSLLHPLYPPPPPVLLHNPHPNLRRANARKGRRQTSATISRLNRQTWQSFDDDSPASPLPINSSTQGSTCSLTNSCPRQIDTGSIACQSPSKLAINNHVASLDAQFNSTPWVNSCFSGTVSSPPSVGGTPINSAGSAATSFSGGFPMAGSVTSPAGPPPATNVQPPTNQPPAQDKYAALADLDNLFNSSNNANNTNNPPEWEGTTNNATWNMNGAYGNSTTTPSSGFINFETPPNPFSSNQQSWTPTQPPPSTFPAGNPFASGFPTPHSNAGSYGQMVNSLSSPPSSTGGYPAVNGQYGSVQQNGGFPPTPPSSNNVAWPNTGTGGWLNFNVANQHYTTGSTGNSFPHSKQLTPGGNQYHVWQTPVGNPFVNSTQIPPRSSSSNPFL